MGWFDLLMDLGTKKTNIFLHTQNNNKTVDQMFFYIKLSNTS